MIKKKDFIEVEFTGKIKESEKVFDTNIAEEAKKANLPDKNLLPLKVCVGEGMVVKGFDGAFEGKEINKEYSATINPEDAFGKRNASLIKTIPLKVFMEKEIMPVPGMVFNMDGMMARIASVSSGRVIVDFNNPLSGKRIEYIFKIKRIINDTHEKLSALIDFFLNLGKDNVEIKISENNASIKIKDDKIARILSGNKKLIDSISKRIKEILGIAIKIEEPAGEKEETNQKQEKSEKNEKVYHKKETNVQEH